MSENENSTVESEARESEPPASKPRLGKTLVAILSSLFLVGFIGYQYLENDFNRPANTQAQETKNIHVRPGMSFASILELLENSRLIRNPGLFHLQARLRGGAKSIQAGVYELKASMTPREIYRHLSEGRVARRTFTVPEGYNIREIARTIQRVNLASEKEILRLSREPSFLREMNISAPTIEGYLFPDTYHFPVGVTAKKILGFMVRTMRRKFSPALRKQAKAIGFTIHQTLTLASIIEKETSLGSERPLIAAVFINRLKRRMRLQSDPTVIYGLPHYDGNITKKDLRYDSPYNTYLYRGLPPGPIASPGLESIKSALNPAKVKYLYFVATKDGGHQFSRTYREHRRAVNRYQRK